MRDIRCTLPPKARLKYDKLKMIGKDILVANGFLVEQGRLNTGFPYINIYVEGNNMKLQLNEVLNHVKNIEEETMVSISGSGTLSELYTTEMSTRLMVTITCISINVDTSGITDFSHMLCGFESVHTIEFKQFDTSNATDMREMFKGCRSLEYLDLSCFDTSKVTDMSYMFNGCIKLRKLNIRKFDTSKVETMCGMFENCYSLERLDIRSFDTANVSDMRHMFADCNNLKRLNFSNFKTISLKHMQGMFIRCEALEELDLSSFITPMLVSIDNAFMYCKNLEYLDISNLETVNVSSMRGVFCDCINLRELKLPTYIGGESLAYCDKMFLHCESLRSLDLQGLEGKNVISIQDMFNGCICLEAVNLCNLSSRCLQKINGAFDNCSALRYVNIQNMEFKFSSIETKSGFISSSAPLLKLVLKNPYRKQGEPELDPVDVTDKVIENSRSYTNLIATFDEAHRRTEPEWYLHSGLLSSIFVDKLQIIYR